MDPSQYTARRATLDDLPALKALWEVNRLPALELERRLTEFQLIVRPDGILVGAVALRVSGTHGLVHSESVYSAPQAEAMRPVACQRLQVLARNQRVARLWMRGFPSPGWAELGFACASADELRRLPADFGSRAWTWSTLSLVDEEVLEEQIENELVVFQQEAQASNERLRRQALWLKRIAGFIAFVFLAGAVVLLYQILTRTRRGPNR